MLLIFWAHTAIAEGIEGSVLRLVISISFSTESSLRTSGLQSTPRELPLISSLGCQPSSVFLDTYSKSYRLLKNAKSVVLVSCCFSVGKLLGGWGGILVYVVTLLQCCRLPLCSNSWVSLQLASWWWVSKSGCGSASSAWPALVSF